MRMLTLAGRGFLGPFFAALLFCAAAAISSSAQTFTSLVSFDGTDGGFPSNLVQSVDGNLYGTTFTYGGNGSGTAFKTTPQGELTTIYNFCSQTNCADGMLPDGSPLTLGANGNLYGGTLTWGTNDAGTIFSMTEAGQLTTLYNFGQVNGPASIRMSLVQGSDGSFYGTSRAGGTYCKSSEGCGTIFKMSTAGVVTTLYSFCSQQDKGGNCLDGQSPGSLLLASNGHLYGVTELGGTFTGGTIFEVTQNGEFNTLYSFCAKTNCADGAGPNWLIQGTDGNLYGTTATGGSSLSRGTVFRFTAKGTLTTLYSFCSLPGCTDGTQPEGLIEASDGNLYGAAAGGGDLFDGTIFQLASSGNLTTLHTFVGTDGEGPVGIVQDTDGSFYGATTNGGGGCDCGTLFSLSTGLGPFVKFVRGYGKVGQRGGIVGQGFTGTTGVFLNGTPAAFTVVSNTLIEATVPAGAASGYVTVDTPSGTLRSNVVFQVR